MLMSQKQTVGSSGEQASVSGAAGSVCPQAEELHGYTAVVRELTGKSLASALRHYHHQGSLILFSFKTLLISQAAGTEGGILSYDLVFLHCSNYDTHENEYIREG